MLPPYTPHVREPPAVGSSLGRVHDITAVSGGLDGGLAEADLDPAASDKATAKFIATLQRSLRADRMAKAAKRANSGRDDADVHNVVDVLRIDALGGLRGVMHVAHGRTARQVRSLDHYSCDRPRRRASLPALFPPMVSAAAHVAQASGAVAAARASPRAHASRGDPVFVPVDAGAAVSPGG